MKKGHISKVVGKLHELIYATPDTDREVLMVGCGSDSAGEGWSRIPEGEYILGCGPKGVKAVERSCMQAVVEYKMRYEAKPDVPIKGYINNGMDKFYEWIDKTPDPYRVMLKSTCFAFLDVPGLGIEYIWQLYARKKQGYDDLPPTDERYTLGLKGIDDNIDEEFGYFIGGKTLGFIGAFLLGFTPWIVGCGLDGANWVERKYREAVEEDELRRYDVNPDVWKLP